MFAHDALVAAVNELGRDVAGVLSARKDQYHTTKTGNRIEVILDSSFGYGLSAAQLTRLAKFSQFEGVQFSDVGLSIVFSHR